MIYPVDVLMKVGGGCIFNLISRFKFKVSMHENGYDEYMLSYTEELCNQWMVGWMNKERGREVQ